ncbi:hypothetical protein HPB47_002814 [Ixodes persulcatus]|uniref:Uncharacterized protein n=1 Tax=Ixodes persulcatus TaxID=34615 RepID=A0AC60PKC5_IXOPE|nr:hypothetical protein HPB47_002814 [Ixodes persulcatus]
MAAYLAWMLSRDDERSLRRERVFRSHITVNDVPEHILERYYRLPKEAILRLCDAVAATLVRPTARNIALPVAVQGLVALRFYASGSFQSVVGEVGHLSQASTSRIVNGVSQALVLISGVLLPHHATSSGPYLDRVLGCINGTHVALKLAKTDKSDYLNRKGYTSVNVQAVCNASNLVTQLTVKWPLSTHASFMWPNCDLYEQFVAGTAPVGWFLGPLTVAAALICPAALQPVHLSRSRIAICVCRILMSHIFVAA